MSVDLTEFGIQRPETDFNKVHQAHDAAQFETFGVLLAMAPYPDTTTDSHNLFVAAKKELTAFMGVVDKIVDDKASLGDDVSKTDAITAVLIDAKLKRRSQLLAIRRTATFIEITNPETLRKIVYESLTSQTKEKFKETVSDGYLADFAIDTDEAIGVMPIENTEVAPHIVMTRSFSNLGKNILAMTKLHPRQLAREAALMGAGVMLTLVEKLD